MKLAIILHTIAYLLGVVPAWDKCIHASCWSGKDAEKRMMNMLSPAMPEKLFRGRIDWMLERGCDTVHWFVVVVTDGSGTLNGVPVRRGDRLVVSGEAVLAAEGRTTMVVATKGCGG